MRETFGLYVNTTNFILLYSTEPMAHLQVNLNIEHAQRGEGENERAWQSVCLKALLFELRCCFMIIAQNNKAYGHVNGELSSSIQGD